MPNCCIVLVSWDIQKEMDIRLINSIDRQKSGNILIEKLVHQLLICLGSKEKKLIMKTKSSYIMKSKIYLIQENQNTSWTNLLGMSILLRSKPMANQRLILTVKAVLTLLVDQRRLRYSFR